MSCMVSGAHLVACVTTGEGVQGQGLWMGEQGGVWLEEQLLCVCIGGGQHWIGDPSWGSRMISMGDRQSPLLSRWRNWGGDSSSLWEGRGLPSAIEVHSSFPGRHLGPGIAVSHQSLSGTQRGTVAGSPGCSDPLHSYHVEGHSPPLLLPAAEAQVPALLPPFPCSGAWERIIFSTWPLSLPGGSPGDRVGKKVAKGNREIWK